ncbi:hypothetical protein CAC42_8209 [Sphaceloma murrayae]|uniref:Uncharacterized protein n=1 Tax=Sphaceloma murrayae TaxID=2082308 RepID=A0A2K1QJ70_9PEZI|nr:hypothetical protein CAC42_8209 [Sphaceloma murrayae]
MEPTLPVIPPPPTDLPSLLLQEQQLTLPSFTATTAWSLGNLLRTTLLPQPRPTVIHISLVSHPTQTLFHVALPGTVPDNEIWVARKARTVRRFGRSTWYMHHKYEGSEKLFAEKNGLGDAAGDYAIHGGGWPIRVKGVEGVVGVIVVSGLAQSEDHGVIVKVLREYIEGLGEGGQGEEEKRKED